MKYPDEHWADVADLVNKGLTPEQVQDHYPDTTVDTVREWISTCRDKGLIDA